MTVRRHSEHDTVLVTGARGFTGQYLCTALRDSGWRVHGLVHSNPGHDDESSCDLTDRNAVVDLVRRIRPTYVVHLAGMAFVDQDNADAFYAVNTVGTENLLKALVPNKDSVRKVLLASSANVYGRPTTSTVDESQRLMPVNHYGCSKLAMEHIAATWFDDLPILITRPFNYTGPGQAERYLVPKIVAHFTKRAPELTLGNLDVSRDFSDVRDVVEAYQRLLAVEAHSLCVNICSGTARSLRSILQDCETLTGHRLEVRSSPGLVRHNDILTLAGDSQTLQQLVGSRSLIPFQRTLAEMVSAFEQVEPA